MSRIALYGGSFDPPHLGHVLTATYVLCSTQIDHLYIIPTFAHAFDKALSPFDLRCAMIEAATAHLGSRVSVDRLEAEREGPSYTIDTVELFSERYPESELLWVGGADTWRDRHSWRAWERLEGMVTPYILGRQGIAPPEDMRVDVTLPAISSTEIRALLAGGEEEAIAHLIPPSVATLIRTHGLYR